MIRALHFSNIINPYDFIDIVLTRFDKAKPVIELMNDRELGRSLAEAGRAYIYQNLSADRAARNYEELYYDALKQ
jgi:glycosyltransferase involved in cell wall biosynthesis